ncbi:MAG: divalent-cation tolerance protein CutA [Gammaproteobacteria bacterium]
MPNKISIIYTTIASKQDAEKLAEQTITNKLAACANIIPGAISIYEWEGKIEKTTEFLIIFKTAHAKEEELYKWLLNNHPYAVPAILRATIDTSPAFNNYVKTHTV